MAAKRSELAVRPLAPSNSGKAGGVGRGVAAAVGEEERVVGRGVAAAVGGRARDACRSGAEERRDSLRASGAVAMCAAQARRFVGRFVRPWDACRHVGRSDSGPSKGASPRPGAALVGPPVPAPAQGRRVGGVCRLMRARESHTLLDLGSPCARLRFTVKTLPLQRRVFEFYFAGDLRPASLPPGRFSGGREALQAVASLCDARK